jgi:zinc/manganese transport system substrate-binding protein
VRISLRPWAVLGACVFVVLGLSACGTAGTRGTGLRVVAAENFWGSIAGQLAGDRGSVRSIIVDPATDPHSYEPTPSDARTLADSTVAIVNGIGYDNWASQLLAADGGAGRIVVSAGTVLGLGPGANPHQWYSPAAVERVVGAIVAAFDRADPAGARYFAARRRLFETVLLARYDALRAEIRRRFAGVPVGYSESIFAPLGRSLGLKLLTPPSFAKAVAEGTDVSAQDKETVERQAREHLIKVWVVNSQNITPEVQQVEALAEAAHIPIVTITETLSPPTVDFEQWQVAQLLRLRGALQAATAT